MCHLCKLYSFWLTKVNMRYTRGLRTQASSLFYNTLTKNKHGWMNIAILIKISIILFNFRDGSQR